MTLLLVLTIFCSSGLYILSNASLSQEDKDNILTLHNTLRRSFATGSHGVSVSNMNKLSWSEDLETRASQSIQCREPLELNELQINLQANVLRGSEGNFTADVLSWFDDVRLFIPEEGTCLDYRRCLHTLTVSIIPCFTLAFLLLLSFKLLNAKHSAIGCAYEDRCPRRPNVFACFYEGGNEMVPSFVRGTPCTKCGGEVNFCEDGLCVSCDTGREECDCRKTCRSPGVGFGRLDVTTCTCTCQTGMGPNCDEECRNPEQYEDWNPCANIPRRFCAYQDLQEMCPEQCSCNKFVQP